MKKKNVKRILAALMAAAVVCTSCPELPAVEQVYAAETSIPEECKDEFPEGATVSLEYECQMNKKSPAIMARVYQITTADGDQYKELHITGTGAIPDALGNWSYATYRPFRTMKIEEGITALGKNLCVGVKTDNIELPESLEKISEKAFYDVQGVTHGIEITIPDSVTSIGASAFKEAVSLAKVDMGKLTSVPDNCFEGCSFLSEINMPCVTSIGSSAFAGCSNLAEIDLKKVKSIGASAFSDCTSLKIAEVSDELHVLEKLIFSNCSKLSRVYFPGDITAINVTSADESPFIGTSGSVTAYFKSSKAQLNRLSSFYNLYSNKGSSYTITMKTDVTPDSYWFSTGLDRQAKKAVIPEFITSIPESAFAYSNVLEECDIPRNVKTIGINAFTYCYNLEAVYIPSSVESIPYNSEGSMKVDAPFFGCSQPSFTIYVEEKRTPGKWNPKWNHYQSGLQDQVINVVYGVSHDAYVSRNDYVLENGVLTVKEGTTSILMDSFGLLSDAEKRSVTRINLPATLTDIAMNQDKTPFDVFPALSDIEVASGSSTFAARDGVLYTDGLKKLIYYPAEKEGTDYELPESVEAIADFAFYHNLEVVKVVFTGEAPLEAAIGDYAFCKMMEAEDCRIKTFGYPNYLASWSANDANANALRGKQFYYGPDLKKACTWQGMSCSHSYSEYAEAIAPTCTTAGIESAICSRCGEQITREISALGHALERTEAVEPTYVSPEVGAPGNCTYDHCTRCGKYFDVDGNEITQADTVVYHIIDENGTHYAPTCTNRGYTESTCKVEGCNETVIEYNEPALGHDMEAHTAITPTCQHGGNKAYYYCKRCKLYFENQDGSGKTYENATAFALSQLKHDIKTENNKATFGKNGNKKVYCAKGGEVSSNVIYDALKEPVISASTFVYNGKAQVPTISVSDVKGKVIPKTEYTLKYSNAKSTAVGDYTITLTFNSSSEKYAGTRSFKYQIKPQLVSGLKLSSTENGSFKATWSKVGDGSGYILYYSQNNDMSKAAKKEINAISTVSATVKGLEAGKKYYVWIVAYKKTAGKSIVGAAAAAKSIKTQNIYLSETKLSLGIKASATLKMKGTSGKVNWKTSDAKVAKVSSKGKVTWVKKGKATITATVGGKSYKCKVTCTQLYSDKKPHFSMYGSGKDGKFTKTFAVTVKNSGDADLVFDSIASYKPFDNVSSQGGKLWNKYHIYSDRVVGPAKLKEITGEVITVKPGQTKTFYIALTAERMYKKTGSVTTMFLYKDKRYTLVTNLNGKGVFLAM